MSRLRKGELSAKQYSQRLSDILALVDIGRSERRIGQFVSFNANNSLVTLGIYNTTSGNCIVVANYDRGTLRVRRNSWYRYGLHDVDNTTRGGIQWKLVLSDNLDKYNRAGHHTYEYLGRTETT